MRKRLPRMFSSQNRETRKPSSFTLRPLPSSSPTAVLCLLVSGLCSSLTVPCLCKIPGFLKGQKGLKGLMECAMQGVIETQHVEALETLLHGLCAVPKERVRVHELCLKSGPNLGSVPSELQLLCDIGQSTPTWTVQHVGGVMRGPGADQLSVVVRTMVQSNISQNALRFYYYLGYKLEYETLKTGFAFNFRRGCAKISITVISVNKIPKLHVVDEAVPVTPGMQLVQVTAPATADNYGEVAASITSFCDHLSPLLYLSKPNITTGIVPTAEAAAASLMSNTGVKSF